MACPRCKATLEKQERDGEQIDACKSCGGMWLHKDQLDKLLVEHEHSDDKYPVIKCRECENTSMKKINFLDYSDIIIDYCPSCGAFWLDKGELGKMNNYIKLVENGEHKVEYSPAYNLLVKLSEISYSIFH